MLEQKQFEKNWELVKTNPSVELVDLTLEKIDQKPVALKKKFDNLI